MYLRELLSNYLIDFRARDGSTIKEVIKYQVNNVNNKCPKVLSVGGNDLLQNIHNITCEDKKTYNQSIQSLKPLLDEFYITYNSLLNKLEYPALCFTIYNPAFRFFNDFGKLNYYQETCEITLNIFNDIIQRLVKRKGFDLLEIRDLMTENSNYANSIEPSHVGGKKIANAIYQWSENLKFNNN